MRDSFCKSEALGREEWFFVFSGYGLYNKIKPVMENGFPCLGRF